MGDAKRGAVGESASETRAAAKTETRAVAVNRRVIVTGDVTVDWNLARTRKLADSGIAWNAADRTEMYGKPGGAALMAGLMTEVAATLEAERVAVEVSSPESPAEPIEPADRRFHHSYAIWARFPKKKGDRDKPIWRVEEFLGLDRAPTADWAGRGARRASTKRPTQADVVIIDDADLGFRDQPDLWPALLRLSDDALAPGNEPQPWVLLKMACPVASGELWRRLLRLHAGRLVVVMTLNDLRLSDVKISRELSWERTAGDLARELRRHPAVNGLTHCAHVVVSLGTGGAVLLSRREMPDVPLDRMGEPDCHVFFDPEAIENSWAEQYPGAMIGYTSCLVGGIARELLLDPAKPDIHRGVTFRVTAQPIASPAEPASPSPPAMSPRSWPWSREGSRSPRSSSRSQIPGPSSRVATRRDSSRWPRQSPARVSRSR
jgi:hypothetical protein